MGANLVPAGPVLRVGAARPRGRGSLNHARPDQGQAGNGQRADRGRRGLLPGLGARAVHPAHEVGRRAVPRRAQRRPDPRSSSTRPAPRATFFTLGWIAERYPATRAAHRRRRARDREPRLRPQPRRRPRARGVPRRHPARQGDPRGPDRHRGEGLPRAELLDRRREPVGATTASWRRAIATARASTRSGTTTTACPTRRASPTSSRPGLLEMPITTLRLLNRNWPAGGGGYFRLLPYARVDAG